MGNRRGQNIAEYAILISLVIAAAVAMQTYVKRGLQARVKKAVDHVGQAGSVGGTALSFDGNQYEPEYLKSESTQSSNKDISNEHISQNGQISRTGINEQSQVDAGSYEEQTYSGE